VSHNGGLIPVPGRNIMVQGWYQGGVNVIDFTDPDNPFEIAYFDRGPVDDEQLVIGGSWGAYWYNGYIYSSELARGLDILELVPSEYLSKNEIEAAKLVVLDQYNPQSQPRIVWPPAFPVVRAYLDQLIRHRGLPEARPSAIAAALDEAEATSGAARRQRLLALPAAMDADVDRSTDPDPGRAMPAATRQLGEPSNCPGRTARARTPPGSLGPRTDGGPGGLFCPPHRPSDIRSGSRPSPPTAPSGEAPPSAGTPPERTPPARCSSAIGDELCVRPPVTNHRQRHPGPPCCGLTPPPAGEPFGLSARSCSTSWLVGSCPIVAGSIEPWNRAARSARRVSRRRHLRVQAQQRPKTCGQRLLRPPRSSSLPRARPRPRAPEWPAAPRRTRSDPQLPDRLSSTPRTPPSVTVPHRSSHTGTDLKPVPDRARRSFHDGPDTGRRQ